jgi:hypothetical protein
MEQLELKQKKRANQKVNSYFCNIKITGIGYVQLFLFQQRTTKRDNSISVNNYCHCCVQMDFIIKKL